MFIVFLLYLFFCSFLQLSSPSYNSTKEYASIKLTDSQTDRTYERNSIRNLDVQVNTHTASYQRTPAAAVLKDGSLVITWASYGQDGSEYGIAARIFDINGNPFGSDFIVNTYTANSQTNPDVAALNDGGFVICWQSYQQDGSMEGIFAQVFNADRSRRNNEFQVNTNTAGNQTNPRVSGLRDGGFVISWTSDGANAGNYFRVYYANGSPKSSETKADSFSIAPTVVCGLEDGTFMMAWTWRESISLYGIRAQMFESDGNSRGSAFSVNNQTGVHTQPEIACLKEGGAVITWMTDFSTISGQAFDIFGDKMDQEFKVSNYTNIKYQSVAALKDGGFVSLSVRDSGEGDQTECYFKMFNGTTNTTEEVRVNIHTTDTQGAPRATAALYLNSFYVVWESWGQDGEYDGVFVDKFSATGERLPFQTNCLDLSGPTSAMCTVANKPVCDLKTGRCRECLAHSECDPSKPFCDLLTFTCRQCLTDDECPSNLPYCISPAGFCAGCKSQAHCTNITEPICDSVTYSCRKCSNDNECPLGSNVCDPVLGACRKCLTYSHCTDPQKPICDQKNFFCKPCIDDSECPSNKTACILTTGTCEECSSDRHCERFSEKPTCHTGTHTCVACMTNKDCAKFSLSICTANNICVGCLDNSDCHKDYKCNKETLRCVVSWEDEEGLSPVEIVLIFHLVVSLFLTWTHPHVFWGFIKTFQYFYYFLFFSIDYPLHLRTFFSYFKFGTLYFFPNVFTLGALGDVDVKSPENFYRNGYSGFFLRTNGPQMFFWVLFGLLMLILYLINKSSNPENEHSPLRSFQKFFMNEYCQIVWTATMPIFMYGALLQVTSPNGKIIPIISYVLAVVMLLFTVVNI